MLWAMGQDVAARPLPIGAVRVTETARHLILHLKDFTAPHIRLALSADERSAWRKTLKDSLA